MCVQDLLLGLGGLDLELKAAKEEAKGSGGVDFVSTNIC